MVLGLDFEPLDLVVSMFRLGSWALGGETLVVCVEIVLAAMGMCMTHTFS